MKKIALVLFTILVIAVVVFFPRGQRPDRSFDTTVTNPAFARQHPVVLIDEAHYNVHTIGSTFGPFASLLRNDGLTVQPNRERFTPTSLARARVLVISNAAGGSNPKLFGLNLVPLRRGERGGPAFTRDEVEALRRWVADGGSLLLIADHAPFGTASAALAEAFGVKMHAGFLESPSQKSRNSIECTRANGLVTGHPLNRGVNRVLSFTGQSLTAPADSVLLGVPADALEFFPQRGGASEPPGNAQAVAFSYGKGRVAIFGEAAMLTAQIGEKGERFGMNIPGTGNRQLVLNVVRWLAGS